VIDSNDVLVGIVTIDDMLDVAEEEATEDIQKLGGSAALDAPYLSIRFPQMIRKRAPWLVILFVSEMLTATAMAFFQDEIAKAVVLALFVPLIISSGGNSGSQATTIVIRAMALGEVLLRDWWKVMRREVFSGLTLGIILGMIGFLRIAVWSTAFHLYGPHWPLIGLTIFFSLIGVVMLGDSLRLNAAIRVAVCRARSRGRFRAICRHARGCHWASHLFHGRAAHSSRHTVINR
jgi:magnesium transporter